MSRQSLEDMLTEIFVRNIRHEGWESITPLNASRKTPLLLAAARRERDAESKIISSLEQVQADIARDGGISPHTYEDHCYAINTVARDAMGQRWWGSALIESCAKEDAHPKIASREQLSRFPEDGTYGESTGTYANIFGTLREGTLFHLAYGDSGTLESMRMFHQGHRNSLKITRIDEQTLIQAINERVSASGSMPPLRPIELPLDEATYRRRIEEFNEIYGSSMEIRIFEVSDGEQLPVVQIPQNPKQLQEFFLANAGDIGFGPEDIFGSMGAATYVIGTRGTGDYRNMDLFLPQHLTNRHQTMPFDPQQHSDEPTCIIPHVFPDFRIPFLALYARKHPGSLT